MCCTIRPPLTKQLAPPNYLAIQANIPIAIKS
jgi:hypothetical protein